MTNDNPTIDDRKPMMESYQRPYNCMHEGCSWRGAKMSDAEDHHIREGHSIELTTSTHHNVQVFPTEDA